MCLGELSQMTSLFHSDHLGFWQMTILDIWLTVKFVRRQFKMALQNIAIN